MLFSGDVTDAPEPHGASELFYLNKGRTPTRILMMNYFNYQDTVPVTCKVLVAQEKAKKFGGNYMVDPNNVLALAEIPVIQRQTSLGLLAHIDGENRFYFSNVGVGKRISASYDQNADRVREYFVSSLVHSVDLRTCLVGAGASVVEDRPEDEFFDLPPEALTKGTIIELIT